VKISSDEAVRGAPVRCAARDGVEARSD
jgi:hypothetical protein